MSVVAEKEEIKKDIVDYLKSVIDGSTGKNNPVELQNVYAEACADMLIATIQRIKITIPTGAVVVTGSQTTQTNPQPIILENVIS